jgi:twitching motility protein PilI
MLKATEALSRHFEVAATSNRAQAIARRKRGLQIGTLRLLVPHDCGGEIIDNPRVCHLPLMPAWCSGLINLRGRLLPVFDLHTCLKVAPITPRSWVLALGNGDDTAAFSIDALPQSLQVDTETSLAPSALPDTLQPFVEAAFRIDGELWLDFQHLRFFRSLSQAQTH